MEGGRGRKEMKDGGLETGIDIEHIWPSEQNYLCERHEWSTQSTKAPISGVSGASPGVEHP